MCSKQTDKGREELRTGSSAQYNRWVMDSPEVEKNIPENFGKSTCCFIL